VGADISVAARLFDEDWSAILMVRAGQGSAAANRGRIQMRKYLMGGAVALLAAMGAVQAEPLATAGVGLASCEKLARDIKPELGFNHMPNALVYYWVQGYMSAANIATLEGDSDYVDLSKYDEKMILPKILEFCTKYPDKKPISLIDDILNDADRLKGAWTKGTVKWAED
jgi:hypothetical protein